MKKRGVLQPEIIQAIAGMGHGDTLVIADAGLPIPEGVRRIDLALCEGVPSFIQTLKAILEELEVESAVMASEASESLVGEVEGLVRVKRITHEEFKQETKKAKAVIRTGEFTPYANIILRSGVVF